MTTRRHTGRLVGALYVGMAFFSALDIQYFPGRFAVAGDPAAIILIQIPLSAWWLSRFRFGPVEWIRRRLTYARPL